MAHPYMIKQWAQVHGLVPYLSPDDPPNVFSNYFDPQEFLANFNVKIPKPHQLEQLGGFLDITTTNVDPVHGHTTSKSHCVVTIPTIAKIILHDRLARVLLGGPVHGAQDPLHLLSALLDLLVRSRGNGHVPGRTGHPFAAQAHVAQLEQQLRDASASAHHHRHAAAEAARERDHAHGASRSWCDELNKCHKSKEKDREMISTQERTIEHFRAQLATAARDARAAQQRIAELGAELDTTRRQLDRERDHHQAQLGHAHDDAARRVAEVQAQLAETKRTKDDALARQQFQLNSANQEVRELRGALHDEKEKSNQYLGAELEPYLKIIKDRTGRAFGPRDPVLHLTKAIAENAIRPNEWTYNVIASTCTRAAFPTRNFSYHQVEKDCIVVYSTKVGGFAAMMLGMGLAVPCERTIRREMEKERLQHPPLGIQEAGYRATRKFVQEQSKVDGVGDELCPFREQTSASGIVPKAVKAIGKVETNRKLREAKARFEERRAAYEKDNKKSRKAQQQQPTTTVVPQVDAVAAAVDQVDDMVAELAEARAAGLARRDGDAPRQGAGVAAGSFAPDE
ncbi:hypothetical protein AMAG_07226 [Allomyces macrogynus ATCC 38327]|uniref:Uncharacterized protein n=1 Tax=Allomyces macrogynus (strain ATCC 38327) TaxID=578462 RepID=A0A0L0SHZ3_ALLM3|nr:hypothetical protein AMAG_07226 [Allomyces macrogynus ATCC 38327]|eukprot:KNE61960.1 hypothetical protein AMAG_07226 [Allomyces macrogynus ATCC 38327]